MPETPERLFERLDAEGKKSIDFFCALAPEQWEQTLYSDGACWTIRQLLAHFVSSEGAFHELIENVLAGGRGAPQDFDIDAFNQRQVAEMALASPTELLEQFALRRRANLELVRRLSPKDLSKTGHHPFLGETSLEEIIQLLYRHNQIHQRDARRLFALGAGESSR